MDIQNDALNSQLAETAATLERYGFRHWSRKLMALRDALGSVSKTQMASEIAKLYGGFGTLMDLAVDPYMLPVGISEEEANKDLLGAINALYEHVSM